jgi:hypothetical protein
LGRNGQIPSRRQRLAIAIVGFCLVAAFSANSSAGEPVELIDANSGVTSPAGNRVADAPSPAELLPPRIRLAEQAPPPAPEGVLPQPEEPLPATMQQWLDEDRRPASSLTLDIAPTPGDLPTGKANRDSATSSQLAEMPAPLYGPLPIPRPVPGGVCHFPLYFEEPRVERYGQSFGLLQPVVSGVHFYSNALLMPAKMIVHPPRSQVCGNRYGPRFPFFNGRPVMRTAGGTTQSAFWTGIFVLP